MNLTPNEATAFSEKHCAVWNTHDLDAICALYTDDAELASPLAAEFTGGGVVTGRGALREYSAAGLARYPELKFTLLNTLLCGDSVTLYFTRGAATMTKAAWRLAQYNIARLLAPLDDPRLAGFVSALDRINTLGDRSPGFVWRHQDADGTSTGVRVRGDDAIIINYTIWESAEALFEYAYHSAHVELFRRRREWFEEMREASLALWWTPAGVIPSVAEADERLDYLRTHGPTAHAFTFKQRFPSPTAQPDASD